MESSKKVLLGMTAGELKELTEELGMPRFAAGQMARWLYTAHVMSIDGMTNLSKANRRASTRRAPWVPCPPPTASVRPTER